MDNEARHLKKQWQAEEKRAARARFPLDDARLDAMFEAVAFALVHTACDHSLRLTTAWLAASGIEMDPVVTWLHSCSGFCDCEVVANARDHWMQNRA